MTGRPWAGRVVIVSALGLACSRPAVSLVAAMSTETSLATLDVDVEREGTPTFHQRYDVAGGAIRLPGTLTFVPKDDVEASEPVKITLTAQTKSGGTIVRRAKVGFVEEHAKLLRMPLHASCVGVPCDPASTPPPVVGPAGASRIVLGEMHACAIDGGGSVHCWGSASGGRLGNGDTSRVSTPTPITLP